VSGIRTLAPAYNNTYPYQLSYAHGIMLLYYTIKVECIKVI